LYLYLVLTVMVSLLPCFWGGKYIFNSIQLANIYVEINGFKVVISKILSGVLQGSVLGTLLFLIYILMTFIMPYEYGPF